VADTSHRRATVGPEGASTARADRPHLRRGVGMTAALDIEGRAESETSPRRKVCSICHKELPIAAFHRRQHHVRSGIRAACRRCTAQRAKEIRDAKGKVATEDERRRNEVRRATRAAIKAGQLVAKPCEVCGTV